jgi:hypothetical protein
VTTVDVVGAHIQYTRGADGKLTGGQLNGAIKNVDVQGKLIPNVANALTTKIMNDQNSGGLTATDMQILSIFDNGGKADPSCSAGTCKNPDGTCAVKGDNKIDVCEVSTAGLIQNVLAPDVQIVRCGRQLPPEPEQYQQGLVVDRTRLHGGTGNLLDRYCSRSAAWSCRSRWRPVGE